MRNTPLLQKVDAVPVPVPDIDAGLRLYRDALGHELRWRHDEIGQAGLALPGSDTEIVRATGLATSRAGWSTRPTRPPARCRRPAAGCSPSRPTSRSGVAVAADPFGNALVLLGRSRGRYVTDAVRHVTGVAAAPPENSR
jgi:catechol 2,3-dioxygenase-like lactoylglutathione lyase family enzyme